MSNAIRLEEDVRKEFCEEDLDAAFVMVNFLRFKPSGPW